MVDRRKAAGMAAAVLMLAVAAAYALLSYGNLLPGQGARGAESARPLVTPVKSLVQASIAGRVVNPGIYELEEGATVADLIDAAGGAYSDADLDGVDMGKIVTPGLTVTIAEKEDGKKPWEEALTVELNHCSVQDLVRATGIEASLARAVVAYRDEHGPFTSVDGLLKVEGMTEDAFDAMKDRCMVLR